MFIFAFLAWSSDSLAEINAWNYHGLVLLGLRDDTDRLVDRREYSRPKKVLGDAHFHFISCNDAHSRFCRYASIFGHTAAGSSWCSSSKARETLNASRNVLSGGSLADDLSLLGLLGTGQ